MKKLTAFSIQKDVVILEYLQDDGKEIIAMIPPYLFCTYLVDCNVIADRWINSGNTLMVSYLGGCIQWRMFVFDSQTDLVYTNELLEAIIKRHEETELLKQVFDVKGNANFSMN